MCAQQRKPNSLQDLLNASPEELQSISQQAGLPSPEEVATEESFLRVVLDGQYREDMKASHLSDVSTTTWRERLRRLWRKPMVLSPALAVAMVVALVWYNVNFVTPPDKPQQRLFAKGSDRASARKGRKPVTLHIGAWHPTQRKVKRLGDQDTCPPGYNVSFGFTLHQAPGYLYLLAHRKNGSLEWLHPNKGKQPRQWDTGFANLEVNGHALHYPLPSTEQTVQFLAVKSKLLLPKKALRHLQGSAKPQRTLTSLKTKYPGLNLAYHTITLHVRKQ